MNKYSSTYEKTNQLNLEEMTTVIKSGHAIAFIGAGCSMPLGYPSWSGLINNLLDECEKNNPSIKTHIQDLRKTEDLLYVADKCKGYLGTTYCPLLKGIFKQKSNKFTDEHSILMKLPFNRFITSNYDPSLDHAYQSAKKAQAEPFTYSNISMLTDFLKGAAITKNKLFYIHGRYDNPEEIILTEKDYQKHYELNQSFTESLKNIFAIHPVVFIGSSLTDLDFMAILRHIGTLFKHYTQGHFVLVPYPEKGSLEIEADRLKTKYNITPVFYHLNRKNDHTERKNLLQQILKETKKPAKSAKKKYEPAIPSTERDFITYKNCLTAELLNLRILDMSRPLNLKDVYVKLSLREGHKTYVPESMEDFGRLLPSTESAPEQMNILKLKAEKPTKTLSIEEALKDYVKIVILGDPGAGKTTLLKHMSLALTEKPFNEKDVLPVFVELKDYISKYKPDFLDYLDIELLKKYGFKHVKRYLPKALEDGKVALFFDGLDEIGGKTQKEAENNYKKIIDVINTVSTRYKNCFIAVTCRKAGWKGQISGAFTILEVLEFSTNDIDNFIKNWFSVESEKSESLIRRLEHRPRLRSLAGNPLLLALLCIIYDRTGLPERRYNLYEKCVDVLLREWDAQRGIKRVEAFSQDNKKQLLQEIAFHFFKEGNRYFKKDQLLTVIKNFLPVVDIKPDKADDILVEISSQHSLLKEQAEGWYGFMHLTLQEFFAATEIYERTLYDIVQKNSFKPWWEEVILLLAGKGDCTTLLKKLLEKEDDIFHSMLLLAGKCLAERPTLRDVSLRKWIVADIKTLIKKESFKLNVLEAAKIMVENNECNFLISILKNEKVDFIVRSEIAEALENLGDKTIVPELLLLLKNEKIDSDVRMGITYALGNLGDKTIVPDLLLLLKNEKVDSDVRDRIASALGNLGDKTIVPELLLLLKNEKVDFIVKSEIAEALGNLGDKTIVPELLLLLKNKKIDSDVKMGIAFVLRNLGDKTIVPELLLLLKNEKIDSDVRRWIAFVLGNLGDKTIVPELLLLLKNEKVDSNVKSEIVKALGNLGDKTIVPDLLVLLKNEKVNLFVRQVIAYALRNLGDKTIVPDLLLLLKNKKVDSDVRRGIAFVLRNLGDKTIVPDLLLLLKNEKVDSDVMVRIAYTLGNLGDKTIVLDLLLLLKNEKVDFIVQSGIVDALGNLGDKTIVPDLILLLKNEKVDSYVKMEIANTLRKLGDKTIVPDLLLLLKNEKVDSDVRMKIANTLGKISESKSDCKKLYKVLSNTDIRSAVFEELQSICKRMGYVIYQDGRIREA